MTVDPTPIVSVATGFMAAKQLFTASATGMFAALAGGPLPVGELAARTELPERSARILADAMVGLGLLTSTGDGYRNSAAAAAYLAGSDGLDLRPFLTFWDSLSYPHWQSYAGAIRTAEPAPFDAVFTSPLGRAVSTAAIFVQALGATTVVVDELAEVHHGCFAGLTDSEIANRYRDEWRRRARDKYRWRSLAARAMPTLTGAPPLPWS